MSTVAIEQVVERVGRLPRLPDTTMRLVGVLSDPHSSIDQIVDVIRFDQAVTAELLRLCNSAAFGLVGRVHSLDDAIRFLGTAKVLQLVMAAHTKSTLDRPQSGYGLPPGALWLHSVAVALCGQCVARRLNLAELGMVFTAGLLHDVGKVVLNELVAQEYAEIARRVTEQRITFLEAEQAVLGYTHAEVGAQVAERWALPEGIVRCIRFHHDPQLLETPDPYVDAVHIADVVCMMMGIGVGDDGLLYRAHPDILARCGLGEPDLEGLGADAVFELRSVQKVFCD